ncbi:MAG: hypothetical protein WAK48_23085 [Candidatus Acidiferrum sp.]
MMKVSSHKTESVYKRYAIANREQRRAALEQIDPYRAQHFGEKTGIADESLESDNAVRH